MNSQAIRIVPLIYLNAQLTPRRTQTLIKQLRSISKFQISAIAMIVDLPSQRAVQADKIVQAIQKSKEKYNIPIYGFTQSTCSPQSYYLLSISDHIYTSPSTLFTFKRHVNRLDFGGLFQKCSLKSVLMKSSENLIGSFIDRFTPPDMIMTLNKKYSNIDQRVLEYAFKNRKQKRPQIPELSKMPTLVLGEQVKSLGLIDGFATSQEILKNEFKGAKIIEIKYGYELSTMTNFFVFVTSPILLLIFLFKVFLKYSILFYIWLKAKTSGAKSLAEVVQQNNYQLTQQQLQWIHQYDQSHQTQQS